MADREPDGTRHAVGIQEYEYLLAKRVLFLNDDVLIRWYECRAANLPVSMCVIVSLHCGQYLGGVVCRCTLRSC